MEFKTEVVISAFTGRMLTSDIGEIYEVLNYLLDDNLFTHQLPRAGRFVKPFILEQHPQLEEWEGYDEHINTENWKEYVEKAHDLFGETLELEPVPNGVWNYKDPIQEAEEMVGKDKVISVTDTPKK